MIALPPLAIFFIFIFFIFLTGYPLMPHFLKPSPDVVWTSANAWLSADAFCDAATSGTFENISWKMEHPWNWRSLTHRLIPAVVALGNFRLVVTLLRAGECGVIGWWLSERKGGNGKHYPLMPLWRILRHLLAHFPHHLITYTSDAVRVQNRATFPHAKKKRSVSLDNYIRNVVELVLRNVVYNYLSLLYYIKS
jgi:hypothetical protein